MRVRIRGPKDFLCGLFFIVIAGFFGISSLGLPMGTASKMGAGYFPWLLSALMLFLGMIIAVRGLLVEGDLPTKIEWRGLISITCAVVAFGVAMTPLGFAPALTLSIAISLLGSAQFTLTSALGLTVGLVMFSWAVFIKALQLPWNVFNPALLGH